MTLTLQLPCSGPITQHFGDMYSGYPHRGLDIGVPVGTPLVASCSGVTVVPVNYGDFGLTVCILSEGLYVLMAHMSRVDTTIGQQVLQGQPVGLSGNTGASTGPHVHIQVCNSAAFSTNIADSRDPLSFIQVGGNPMSPAEKKIERYADGTYEQMAAAFDILRDAKLLALEDSPSNVVPAGQDSDSSADYKRRCLRAVLGQPDAAVNAAAALLG